MTDDEPLLRIVEGGEYSLRNGRVVWGAVLKANDQLWQPGQTDLPAMVAWSPDPWFDDHPTERSQDLLDWWRRNKPADPFGHTFSMIGGPGNPSAGLPFPIRHPVGRPTAASR